MCLKLKVTIRLWVCECEQNEEKPNARSDSTRNLWSQNQKMLKLKNGCPWYFPPHLTSPWCWAGAGAQLGRWGPYITPWGAKPAQERGTGGTTGNDIKHPLRIPRTEQWAGSISLHGSLVPGWGWGWLSDWWWTNDARIVGDTPQKIIGGVIISIISCLDTRNDHYLCGNSDIQISAHLNLPLRSISSNVCELANGLLRIMRMYPNFKQQLTKTWPYPHRGCHSGHMWRLVELFKGTWARVPLRKVPRDAAYISWSSGALGPGSVSDRSYALVILFYFNINSPTPFSHVWSHLAPYALDFGSNWMF